jgi:hypothetical protein
MVAMTTNPASTALAWFRSQRVAGISLFVLLLLLVGAERRLADAHFNLRTAATGLESKDILDGDEIRVRLVVLNDETLPTLPVIDALLVFTVVHPPLSLPASVALGSPAPRGPPRPVSSG